MKKEQQVHDNDSFEEICNCPNCQYEQQVLSQLAKLQPEQEAFFSQMYEFLQQTAYELEGYVERDKVKWPALDNQDEDDEFFQVTENVSRVLH